MHAKQRPEFVGIITALAVTFGREASEALLTGYWMALQDLPLDDLKRAAARAIHERTFMPVPAELRELAGELTPEARAVIAWKAALDAERLHGYYGSVDFDDKAVNATIRNMGGWEKFTERLENEDREWLRKEFLQIYAVYCRRGVTASEAMPLGGFHSRMNHVAHLEHVPAPVLIHTTLKPTPLLGPPRKERPLAIAADVAKLTETVGRMP
jgi:hypothetical protein